MESKKINQLATELTPALSDLTIIGDPTTGISKKITLSQMASLFTGTVEEYATKTAFPLVGVADTIYIALDTNVLWRWDTGTNAYVELSPNIINSLVFNDANGFDGTISLVGSVATLTITTALTTGSVGFIGASGALLQDNANFFWDDTNNRLGIGTNAPTTAIDTFGSGIITRVNGTSTNNSFIGFASAGTNKWSVGNVQSDHRFRIYNEATTSELVSVLQTGEFGIGIVNPTTKLHIDGGASVLIANLDANVSVAKSISFRSDNSNRINLEVSGTESGSNAGANFFLRTYTDLGALIETPFSIVRSTGVTTIKSLTLTNALSIANGGTGSTTQNFVDLTTTQSIGGAKTFTSALNGTTASFDTSVFTASLFLPANGGIGFNGLGSFTTSVYSRNSGADLCFNAGDSEKMRILGNGNVGIATDNPSYKLQVNGTLGVTGAATFLSSVMATNYKSYLYGFSALRTYTKLAEVELACYQSVSGYPYTKTTDLVANADTGAESQFRLLTAEVGGNPTTRLFVSPSGNVGIGTSSPLAKATVRGGNLGNTPSMASTVLSVQNNDQGIFMGSYNGTPNFGSWIQAGREAFDLGFPLVLQPIAGNVLIGTSTDNGNKLQINGSSYLGTSTIITNSFNNTAGQYGNSVSAEFGAATWTLNLSSILPNYTFSGRGLSVILQILGLSDGSNGSSILVNAYKSIGGTWVINTVNTALNGTTFINSITGSGTTITINWNTTAFGCVAVNIINRG